MRKHDGLSKLKENQACPRCDTVFNQKRVNQKWCSKKCKDAISQLNTRPPKGAQEKNCVKCGVIFKARLANIKYCSDECRKHYKPTHKVERACNWCGEAYKASAGSSDFCSEDCSYRHRYDLQKKNKEIFNRKCEECGRHFTTVSPLKRCCTKRCNNKINHRQKEIRRRKRILENGEVNWDISVERLMKRDKGVCYLCGESCDYNDKQIDARGHVIVGKAYPTTEHVIPISKGGTHTWDNVKLAHHRCNTLKRDKVLM